MTNKIYQLLPALSDKDYGALKADIAERGVMVPIEYDQDGNVIDGHHRLRICEELGIVDPPRISRTFASEADKRTHARQLNLARRHLNQEQRRALIEEELRDRPERSNNQIAESLGVSDTTVGTIRSRLEATSQIGKLETTIGADGKSRPAKRPKLVRVDLGIDGHQATLESAKAIRAERYEGRRAANLAKIAEISNANSPLPRDRKYPIIYADPPWHFRVYHDSGMQRAAQAHYPTMELSEICRLPIAELATSEAVLFMWTTAPNLREAFEVLDAWGFDYCTHFVWVKDKWGLGFWVRNQHELLLIAKRGNMPAPLAADRISPVITAARREHSRKPDEAYGLIERMYPELPKIELFARHARPGWNAWGNQADNAKGEMRQAGKI